MKKNVVIWLMIMLAALFGIWLGEVGFPALGLARIPSLLLGVLSSALLGAGALYLWEKLGRRGD